MMDILNNYDLDVLKTEKLEKGYVANKWLIYTKNGQYILKEENVNEERLNFILEVINSLGDLTPEIIQTKNNKMFAVQDDKKYYLTKFCETAPNKSNNKFFEIGAFLAELHNQMSNIVGIHSSFLKNSDNEVLINEYLADAKKENLIEYVKIIEYKKEVLKAIKEESINFDNLHTQIVHGDFYLDNLLYVDGNYKVIDFDQCCDFYREYEMMRAMIMICLDDDKDTMFANMKEFIHGYMNCGIIFSSIDAYNFYLYVQANSLSSLSIKDYCLKNKREFAQKRHKILKLLFENKNDIIDVLDNRR